MATKNMEDVITGMKRKRDALAIAKPRLVVGIDFGYHVRTAEFICSKSLLTMINPASRVFPG